MKQHKYLDNDDIIHGGFENLLHIVLHKECKYFKSKWLYYWNMFEKDYPIIIEILSELRRENEKFDLEKKAFIVFNKTLGKVVEFKTSPRPLWELNAMEKLKKLRNQ